MAAPKVYKSTDADAPVLNGTALSAIDLIRKICITGYGTQASLGWEEVFAKDGVIVIRPPETAPGNRLLYRIDDTGSGLTVGTKKIKIEMYESMADVDTGSGKTGPSYVWKSWDTSITPRDWIVVGDHAGFYIFTKYNVAYTGYGASGLHELSYIGSGIPLFFNDAWFSVIVGDDTEYWRPSPIGFASTVSRANTGGESPYTSVLAAANIDRSLRGIKSQLQSNGGVHLNWLAGTGGPSYPAAGQLLYSRPIVNNGVAYSMRGYLPGLYHPEHASGLIHGSIIEADGKRMMVFRGFQYDLRNWWVVLIDIGEGFRS